MAEPAAKFRDGVLTVTIWKNETEDNKAFYSANLTKSYKDSSDEWQETNSLNYDDLLKASNLFQQAYNKIIELKQS